MSHDTARVPTNEELAIEWVNDLAKPSNAGQGGDDALFNAACVLFHGFDLRERTIDALRHYNAAHAKEGFTLKLELPPVAPDPAQLALPLGGGLDGQ